MELLLVSGGADAWHSYSLRRALLRIILVHTLTARYPCLILNFDVNWMRSALDIVQLHQVKRGVAGLSEWIYGYISVFQRALAINCCSGATSWGAVCVMR